MTPWLDDGDVQLYHGDVIDTLRALPSGIAQTCVTSPPYWGLRDYGTGEWTGGDPECNHQRPSADERKFTNGRGEGQGDEYAGSNLRSWTTRDGTPRSCRCGARRVDQQLGLEATPELYVERMVAVFREVWRVLRDDGTCWVNLGDSYATNGAGSAYGWTNGKTSDRDRETIGAYKPGAMPDGLKPKDLVGIPWRVAFALQADGWYLRSDIIWSKPNPMPESVSDRPTKAHEYLFLLAKQPRYFMDMDAIREPNVKVGTEGHLRSGNGDRHPNHAGVAGKVVGRQRDYEQEGRQVGHHGRVTIEAGRNRRSVWTIPTQPYPEAHFATYPEALVRPCILAGTSEKGECSECGAPWQREVGEVEVVRDLGQRKTATYNTADRYGAGNGGNGGLDGLAARMREGIGRGTTGWRAFCSCSAPTRPQLVLDPFIGSGTTALVARNHGRRCIGIDLSAEYLAIAARRLQQLSLLAVDS